MQEISSSVRQRLRARPEPQVHPDPDLLTAYVEQVLPVAERNKVVEHLAECSYCREIVSLSLPEPAPAQVVVQGTGRSRWWIPAYRWAAVAATLAIAATLVIEKPWKTGSSRVEVRTTFSNPSQPAANEAASPGVSAATQPTSPESTGPALKQTEPRRMAPAPTRELSGGKEESSARLGTRDDSAVRVSQAAKAPAGTGSGVMTGTTQTRAAMPPPPPVSAVQPGAAVQQDYVNRAILRNQAADASVAEALPQAPSPKPAAAQDAASARKSAPKITPQDLRASAMDVPVTPPTTTGEQAAPPAADSTNLAKSSGFMPKFKSTLGPAVRAAITTAKKAAGGGKPSAGSGSYTFGGTPSAVARATESDVENKPQATSPVRWTIKDGRLLRSTDVGGWHQVYSDSPDIQFRVVQPHGSEVWAGGNNGTLIHSWDGGVDWSKLSVPDSSSSDITGISIDGDNVQVKTSNGQTFVSDDHGKTWVPLQPK